MAMAEFDALIELIYGAVGQPAAWNEAVAEIGAMMNAERVLFYLQDLKANSLLFFALHNIDLRFMKIFEEKHLNSPITFPKITTSESVVKSTSENVSKHEMENSEIYRDIMAPLNVYHGSGALVLRDENTVGVVLAMRSREAGYFSDDEDDILVRLVPHLSRASRLHYRLLATELERAAAAGVLDRLAHAVLICDGEARILLSNAAAKTMLDAKRGLRFVGGHLAGSTADQSNRLVAAIASIGRGAQKSVSVVLENDEETFRILAARLRADLRLEGKNRTDLVMVSFSDPAADLAASASLLKDMLQLTEAEARVALGLAHGKTLLDLAADLDVSLNTVRTHLAASFAKTQTNRQADLVRLVLRTVGPFGLA
jgi:DNA-binding CsgD family transcriptional regulator